MGSSKGTRTTPLSLAAFERKERSEDGEQLMWGTMLADLLPVV